MKEQNLTPEQMAKRIEELEKEAELTKNIADNTEKIADNYERGAKYQKEANETGAQANERILKQSDAVARELRLRLDMAKLNNDNVTAQQVLYEMQEELAELTSIAFVDQTEAQKERIKFLDEELKAQKRNGLTAKQYSKADLAAKEKLDSVMSSLADHTGIFSQKENSFVGSIFNVASTMKEAHQRGEMFTDSLKQYFNLTNFATSIVEKTVESTIALVKELDKAATSFAAATGMGDKYLNTLADMRMEGNVLGVTFENAGNALKGLTQEMVGFVNMSEQAKVNLAMTVARFERIGIDANTSAQSINNFTLNMGKSEQQAMAMTKELAMMGQSAGISAGKMTKDFQAAFKSLAVYGEKSIEVFQGLASAARAAGIEVATLTSLAGKFDTFSGAAETVGKLNALLGSQLSSTEMLMMTEDQRVETLIQQVQAQGINFKDMNKFQQMAIANAAGINDMNEAQRIFGMNMKDYKKYRKDMESQQNIQERFNEAIEATLPLTEKFSIFIANFAQAIKPLLGLVEGLVDILIYLTGNRIAMGFLSLAAGAFLLYKAFFGGLAIIRNTKAAMETLKASKLASLLATEKEIAADAVSDAQKTKTIAKNELEAASNKKKTGSKELSALATKKEMGAEVLNNVQKDKTIAKNELERISNIKNAGAKNVSATGSMNLGRSGMIGGKMAGKGALGMLKLALAIFLIGAGVGMAAAGIGYMVSSFTELAAIGPEAVSSLTAFSLAMAGLMASGAMGLFGAGGLMLGMMIIKDGLEEIGEVLEDNVALQEGLENLALVSTGKGAAAMKAGGATLAGDLKAAVSAAMTQKLEVVIKLKDAAFKDMVEDIVVNSVQTDGRVAKAIVKMA